MVDGTQPGGYGLTGPPDGGAYAEQPARGMSWPVRSGPVPPLADGFTPRVETVPDVEAALVPGITVALVPAPGGGADDWWLMPSGKTQLAADCAERLWRGRAVDLLLWINASSRASALSGYMRAAVVMGADPGGDTASTAAHLLSWLAESTRSWLVVLDDLRAAADLDGLWPQGPAGRVLVTTPDAAAVAPELHAVTLPVPLFSAREATAFISGRLSANPDQRNGAIDLVYDLASEPAALGHAGSVIATSGLSCRDYRKYYSEWHSGLTASGGSAAAVTWALSAAYADQVAPGSRGVLSVTAFLDGHAIPGNVFTTSALSRFLAGDAAGQPSDPERTWRCVRALEVSGLVSIDTATAPPVVRIARQVQQAIRAQLSPELSERAVRAAADTLLEVWPKDAPRTAAAADMRACASALREHGGDLLCSGGRCHPVLMLAGQSLDGARMSGPAVTWWRELIATCEPLLGTANPDTAAAGGRLADALLAAGQSAEAVTWYQWALTGRISLLGPDHPGTISARATLGHALVAAGRPGDAVAVLSDAVADCERIRGTDHLDTLAARDECAAACVAAGNSAMAVRLYQRSQADRERLQGMRHPDTMAVAMALADAYLSGGKSKDAIAQARQILAGREQALGAGHLDTLGAQRRLGEMYSAAGKIGPALAQYELTCAGLARTLGPDHRETLTCQGELARLYYSTGRLSDAVTTLTKAISRGERALAPGDAVTQALRRALAEITG